MSSRVSGESLVPPALWAGNLEVAIAGLHNHEAAAAEDSELVICLQHCAPADLDLLFERYSRLVLGIACRVLGDLSEAEEVVQEVFLYLCRKPELFDPSKGSFKAWIVQLTFSRALDRKSYLARRTFCAAEDLDSMQLREEIDLEKRVDAKLSRKHLELAFAELTDMQRRTIQSFYFDGLSLREISELLRKPLGTVRHHLYRGLGRLRKSALLHRLV